MAAAQLLERPVDRREREPLAAVLERLLKQLDQPITVADMAVWAAMSERTFIRRFCATTGTTPADWLTDARMKRARKKVGLSPSDYRNGFSQLAQSSSR
jgi:AraC family transcriptional activator FtrA